MSAHLRFYALPAPLPAGARRIKPAEALQARDS
jgi:hypothetical protein